MRPVRVYVTFTSLCNNLVFTAWTLVWFHLDLEETVSNKTVRPLTQPAEFHVSPPLEVSPAAGRMKSSVRKRSILSPPPSRRVPPGPSCPGAGTGRRLPASRSLTQAPCPRPAPGHRVHAESHAIRSRMLLDWSL